MTNKQYTVLFVAALIVLVVIFFLVLFSSFIGLSDFGAQKDIQVAKPATFDINKGPDPLITPAARLYTALINESDPVRGNPQAKLVIMEFGDFECPYCKQQHSSLVEILAEYKGQVSLVWKDFPIPTHLQAKTAALAARCAGEQGKFWEYHDYLFANQSELSHQTYNQIALELDFNLGQFNNCLDSQKYIKEVGQGLVDGQRLGVDATPYLFIGNKRFNYALAYEELKKSIEEELVD